MKKMPRLLLVGMLMLGLICFGMGCAGDDESSQPDENQTPKLIVGSQTTYPPFEMVGPNGDYIGFDMDLIRAIGEVQGYEIEINSLGFDALIPALDAGNVDCTISAQSITPERLEKIDFSDPYFTAGLIVAVRADNEDIKGLEDLKLKSYVYNSNNL